jgi:hypothetical protein
MFTGNENHQIDLNEAKKLTKNFRDAQTSSEYIKAEYFSKNEINRLMNQPESVGIRIYYGLDDENIPRLVIVSVNENENDLTEGIILENGLKCPPKCGNMNELNS